MSKAEGQLVAIKFTDNLVGDVSGLTPAPLDYTCGTTDYAQGKTATTSNAAWGAASLAVDGNDATYWGCTSLPGWLMIDFGTAKNVGGFYARAEAPFRGKDYQFLGSNDGTNWTVIKTGTLADTLEQTVPTNRGSYRYVKWTFTTSYSSGIVCMYTFKVLDPIPVGNERAFTITGQQYQHVNGPLINGDYQMLSVTAHPDGANTILLTLKPLKRFNNVEGQLRVTYNAALGNLQSRGGLVESFSILFTPTGLLKKVNPWDRENLTVQMLTTFVASKVTYKPGYLTERITAQILPTVTVTKVGSNPL